MIKERQISTSRITKRRDEVHYRTSDTDDESFAIKKRRRQSECITITKRRKSVHVKETISSLSLSSSLPPSLKMPKIHCEACKCDYHKTYFSAHIKTKKHLSNHAKSIKKEHSHENDDDSDASTSTVIVTYIN